MKKGMLRMMSCGLLLHVFFPQNREMIQVISMDF